MSTRLTLRCLSLQKQSLSSANQTHSSFLYYNTGQEPKPSQKHLKSLSQLTESLQTETNTVLILLAEPRLLWHEEVCGFGALMPPTWQKYNSHVPAANQLLCVTSVLCSLQQQFMDEDHPDLGF